MATPHDLHFTIEGAQDGSSGVPPQQHFESPRAGELDHLPAGTVPANSGGFGGTSSFIGNASYTETISGLAGKLGEYIPESVTRQASEFSTTAGSYIQEHVFRQSAHPFVIVFHVLFKAAALFFYVFARFFIPTDSRSDSGAHFISLTVLIILLLAADFWVVKNVTGRLLVGLRWWNKVENDTTTWIFESYEDHPVYKRKQINSFDRTVFWTVLYATPCVWGFFLFVAIMGLQLKWIMVVIMALALSSSNVYGYYKCSTEQKAKLSQYFQTHAQQGAMAVMQSSVLGFLTGAATGAPQAQNANTNNYSYSGGRPAPNNFS